MRRTTADHGRLVDDHDLDAWVNLYCRDGVAVAVTVRLGKDVVPPLSAIPPSCEIRD